MSLGYQYNHTENLAESESVYNSGLVLSNNKALQSYTDVTIDGSTCFVLTSATQLQTVFKADSLNLFNAPVAAFIQLLNSTNTYITTDSTSSVVQRYGTSNAPAVIMPVGNAVELIINGGFVYFEDFYPFNVKVQPSPLSTSYQYQQQFIPCLLNGFIAFRAQTSLGDRYLTIGQDNKMRATGLMLNNTVFNNYLFTASVQNGTYTGLSPENKWVTYFLGTMDKDTTVDIKKEFSVDTNYLISLSINDCTDGQANINVANLRTTETPTGTTTALDNS